MVEHLALRKTICPNGRFSSDYWQRSFELERQMFSQKCPLKKKPKAPPAKMSQKRAEKSDQRLK
jgi:hypothetical protein